MIWRRNKIKERNVVTQNQSREAETTGRRGEMQDALEEQKAKLSAIWESKVPETSLEKMEKGAYTVWSEHWDGSLCSVFWGEVSISKNMSVGRLEDKSPEYKAWPCMPATSQDKSVNFSHT